MGEIPSGVSVRGEIGVASGGSLVGESFVLGKLHHDMSFVLAKMVLPRALAWLMLIRPCGQLGKIKPF